ncbi:hypothetical protein HHI36_016521, partial [Cryptolaemus montrouzieri]
EKKIDIKAIFNSNMPTIAAGDLNAKDSDWNSRKTNKSGWILKTITERNNIIAIGPREPTHLHTATGTMDKLDIGTHEEHNMELQDGNGNQHTGRNHYTTNDEDNRPDGKPQKQGDQLNNNYNRGQQKRGHP